MKSDLQKQAANEHSTEKQAARLIHANYRGGKDVLVGLDYDQEGYSKLVGADLLEDPEAERDRVYLLAEHQAELWIRRVMRECRKEGVELRYMVFTSDMDGETQEPVRVHHHIVMNVEALEICKRKWNLGGVNWKTMWDREDQSDLAAYLVRQVRRRANVARYIASRNLVRPKPKDRVAINGSELRLPKGATLLYRSPYRPGQAQYIRYVLPQEETVPKEGGGGRGRNE